MTELGKTIEFILVNLCFLWLMSLRDRVRIISNATQLSDWGKLSFPFICISFSSFHFYCHYHTEAQTQALKHAKGPYLWPTFFRQNSRGLSILLLSFSVSLPDSCKLRCCFWFGKYISGVNINPLVTSLHPHCLCFKQSSRLLTGLPTSLTSHCSLLQ